MKALTEKQKAILEFIQRFTAEEGMPPTISEIAENFGITQPTAYAHIRALDRKGYITRSSKARSVRVVNPFPQTDDAEPTANARRTEEHPEPPPVFQLSIPLLGRISAGAPLLAEEHVEDTIHFDPHLLPRRTVESPLFALRVTGDSMRDLGILDGDIVIARRQHSANIGDIVVAVVDNETTVKSLYYTNGMVELRPANPDYESQIYPPERVAIQGVVVALHRVF